MQLGIPAGIGTYPVTCVSCARQVFTALSQYPVCPYAVPGSLPPPGRQAAAAPSPPHAVAASAPAGASLGRVVDVGDSSDDEYGFGAAGGAHLGARSGPSAVPGPPAPAPAAASSAAAAGGAARAGAPHGAAARAHTEALILNAFSQTFRELEAEGKPGEVPSVPQVIQRIIERKRLADAAPKPGYADKLKNHIEYLKKRFKVRGRVSCALCKQIAAPATPSHPMCTCRVITLRCWTRHGPA